MRCNQSKERSEFTGTQLPVEQKLCKELTPKPIETKCCSGCQRQQSADAYAPWQFKNCAEPLCRDCAGRRQNDAQNANAQSAQQGKARRIDIEYAKEVDAGDGRTVDETLSSSNACTGCSRQLPSNALKMRGRRKHFLARTAMRRRERERDRREVFHYICR